MYLNNLKLCRLCMSTTHLEGLFTFNSYTPLHSVILFCTNIKVQPGDGLPDMICSDCSNKLKMFHNFKQICLEVDLKFQQMSEKSKYVLDETIVTDVQTMRDTCESVEILKDSILRNQVCDNNLSLKHKTNGTDQNKKINKLSNSFQCEQCGRTFKIKTVLEKHMTIHTGIKPFACKICTKSFTRAENRMIHMRSHLGIKPYVCEICGSTSTKRQDLIRHMKIHSDERKYSCPICSRSFKRSSDVNSHMRSHTGLRPYKCNMCGKTYTSNSGLRKHYKTQCKKVNKK